MAAVANTIRAKLPKLRSENSYATLTAKQASVTLRIGQTASASKQNTLSAPFATSAFRTARRTSVPPIIGITLPFETRVFEGNVSNGTPAIRATAQAGAGIVNR